MSDPELELDVSQPQPASLAQRRLGRYVLCYELASGGMATVYLGRTEGQQGFGRLVAIKVIHPHLATQREFVEMFLDEARIASRIVHPNVCSVFDFGEEDGTYFLAMDYLVGENAGRVMRAIARKPEIAARPAVAYLMARIIADACEGLHAAHELRGDDGELVNLVHRDVTPHNLFVGYDGSVRVVDFGVALAVGRTHHTAAGTLKGKFPYMSPEQISTNQVDRRSDVWALGVCFWELLVRRRLFRRDNEFQTLKAVTEAVIMPPSKMSPGVPEVFDAIIARALDRDRDRRYATARQMGRDINAALGTLGGAGSADVAELMDELFAAERAERALLLEKARRVDPELPSTSKITRVGLHETGSALVTAPPKTIEPPAAAPSRKPAVIASVAVIVALLGIVVVSQSPMQTTELEHEAASEGTAPLASDTTEETPEDEAPTEVAIADAPEAPEPEAPEPEAAEPALPARTGGRPRTRARTEASPARAGVGTVNVVTPPGWAEIFVDGERVGRSPTSIQLPAGRRSVRLLPYGDGPAITRSVEVSADETTRLVVRLEPSE